MCKNHKSNPSFNHKEEENGKLNMHVTHMTSESISEYWNTNNLLVINTNI